jgi:hypothetical protein
MQPGPFHGRLAVGRRRCPADARELEALPLLIGASNKLIARRQARCGWAQTPSHTQRDVVSLTLIVRASRPLRRASPLVMAAERAGYSTSIHTRPFSTDVL